MLHLKKEVNNLFIGKKSASYEVPDDSIDSNNLGKLSEYFLELLIHIICERFEPFLSKIEPNARLEREVLHFLCNLEPISFSLLSTKVYRDLVTNIY